MYTPPENTAETQKNTTTRLAAALFLVIFVYPLSIGPVAWLDRSRIFPKPFMDVVLLLYFPMDWLYDHSEAFRKILDWYLGFWR